MLNEQTVQKLEKMKLSGIAEAYQNQNEISAYNTMSFDERFGLLVDAEYAKRKRNKIVRIQRQAQFRNNNACIEDIDYSHERKLSQNLILELSSCNYIAHARNIVINGATGAGKSYVAQALGQAACRQGIAVCYRRLPDLLDELRVGKQKSLESFIKLRKRIVSYPLLIIDEWLTFPIREDANEDLLAIIDRRRDSRSTIVVSQFAPAEWLEQMPNRIAGEAITDRLVAGAYHIVLEGNESMRNVLV